VLDIFKMNPTPSASGPRGAVRLRPAAAGATPTGSESFWQELTEFAEDIYHAIRNGAIKVKNVETDLARKVVSLTLSLEGLADQVIEFVIHTVEDAGHALHNAFLWIVKAIDTALDWLKGSAGPTSGTPPRSSRTLPNRRSRRCATCWRTRPRRR
jgi:hypothetical protein